MRCARRRDSNGSAPIRSFRDARVVRAVGAPATMCDRLTVVVDQVSAQQLLIAGLRYRNDYIFANGANELEQLDAPREAEMSNG
jgi:hypothetical protein